VDADPLTHLLTRGAPRSPDLASLEAWGRAVGAALPLASVVTLDGDLGAGKTTLARALCEGAGVLDPASVTSPTFAIIHRYPAAIGEIAHVDLYRVRDARELEALGWDELVATAPLLLVEWPDRAVESVPASRIRIRLSHDTDHADRRLLQVERS